MSFSGEIGYDFGGVRAEFFHCLFEELTQPEYGLFTYPEDASCMWFPARVSPRCLASVLPERKGAGLGRRKLGYLRCWIAGEELQV